MDYYSGHDLRFGSFDLGENYLDCHVVTAGKNKSEQSEIKVWNITQPFKKHKKHH